MRPILGGKVNFPFCLAPMVGLSHVVLRQIIRSYMPEDAFTIWPTEMLNSRRLPQQGMDKSPLTLKEKSEIGLVPQILGNKEEFIAGSLKVLKEWGAEGVDINMGCPVSKALRHNYGVALMGDPKYAAEVVRMTVRHAEFPVSVKLRSGDQGDMDFLTKFVLGIEDAGASWVCLHPREAKQKRRGRADWEQVRELRRRVSLPVIGNGDVQTAEDALRMKEESSCDAVMIGRALSARPWVMWQIGEKLGLLNPVGREGSAPITPEEEGQEYGRYLVEFTKLCRQFFKEDYGVKRVKFLVRVNHCWLDFGHAVYKICENSKTYDELEERLTKHFSEKNPKMVAKTNLRF